MTEAEWLAATDPTPMLEFLRGKASDRKLRLFTCGCCRRVWHLFRDEECRGAVELGERLADGMVSNEERRTISVDERRRGLYGWGAAGMTLGKPAARSAEVGSDQAARMTASSLATEPQRLRNRVNPSFQAEFFQHLSRERSAQTPLLRHIFGNPFRPVAVEPAWLTPTVVAVASQMYEIRDFAAMPILADALEDAGCSHEGILSHCRGAGPHVKGCWVVDLLTGRK